MIIFIMYVYTIIISFPYMINYRTIQEKEMTEKIYEPRIKFAILIPAHNEEEVIVDTIDSISKLDYPKELFDIFVMCDNCNDNTVKNINDYINNNNHLNIFPIEVKGGTKTKALLRGIEYIHSNLNWNYDNIVLIDADNLVSPTLLNTFNNYICEGNEILQCSIHSKNNNNLISKGFTAAFNNLKYTSQWTRNRFNLSAYLSGTGFTIPTKYIHYMYETKSLTEDLELGILLILEGEKIKFIKDEYILNQHLEEYKPSITQRIRWSIGSGEVLNRYISKLLIEFIKRPSFQLFDTIMVILTPSKYILYSLTFTMSILKLGSIKYIPSSLIVLTFIYSSILVILTNNKDFKLIIAQVFYSINMLFVIPWGYIKSLSKKEKVWIKTVHKKVDINI